MWITVNQNSFTLTWRKGNVISYECGLKWKSLKWMWSQINRSQMSVVSKDWFQMTVVSNEYGLKWLWSQMNVVSNERGLKWTWSQMNVVSNERGLIWTGLIWMWSQMNRSQMSWSQMNVVVLTVTCLNLKRVKTIFASDAFSQLIKSKMWKHPSTTIQWFVIRCTNCSYNWKLFMDS